MAEQGKIKELNDYLSKLESPDHRVNACLGAASFFIEGKKRG